MLLVGAILLAIFVLSSPWSVVAVVAAAVVEAAETAFWVRLSRRRRVAVGAETLIGATAEVTAPCFPDGQVKVGGELWQARAPAGAEVGETVRIRGRDGLTLFVEPD